MQDSFQTLAKPSTGEFRDRGSKFLAYAFPAESEEDWQNCLEKVKKEHPKARHHCYAYRIGLDRNNFRANDDGEPSGTAGRPILGQIDSHELTNVFIVVVRYFGGTLLGTSGLINAYKLSAQDALSKGLIIEKLVEDNIRIHFEYGMMGEVMNAVKKTRLTIKKQHFEETAFIDLAIRKSETESQLIRLKAILAKVSLEEAELLDELEGVWFEC
ncbi:MAG: YigZ family protein [Bacteroidota bacterium]